MAERPTEWETAAAAAAGREAKKTESKGQIGREDKKRRKMEDLLNMISSNVAWIVGCHHGLHLHQVLLHFFLLYYHPTTHTTHNTHHTQHTCELFVSLSLSLYTCFCLFMHIWSKQEVSFSLYRKTEKRAAMQKKYGPPPLLFAVYLFTTSLELHSANTLQT